MSTVQQQVSEALAAGGVFSTGELLAKLPGSTSTAIVKSLRRMMSLGLVTAKAVTADNRRGKRRNLYEPTKLFLDGPQTRTDETNADLVLKLMANQGTWGKQMLRHALLTVYGLTMTKREVEAELDVLIEMGKVVTIEGSGVTLYCLPPDHLAWREVDLALRECEKRGTPPLGAGARSGAVVRRELTARR